MVEFACPLVAKVNLIKDFINAMDVKVKAMNDFANPLVEKVNLVKDFANQKSKMHNQLVCHPNPKTDFASPLADWLQAVWLQFTSLAAGK